MKDEIYSARKVSQIYSFESNVISSALLEGLVNEEVIPKYSLFKSGAVNRKGWKKSELPRIGEKLGFLNRPSRSTVIAVFYANLNSNATVEIKQIMPSNFEGIIFLAAFMGWMPAPLDVSIWQSIWTKEKISLDKTMNFKTALFDFNIGYLTTVVLGICFIGLGAFVMYNSGESFSNNGGEFAGQLINLYTSSLGENMFLLIAIAAFTTMFSTTLTCLDASPRAMGKSLSLLGYKKLGGYTFWLILLSVGTFMIFVFLMSEMGTLVKIATILSFITAPVSYTHLTLPTKRIV